MAVAFEGLHQASLHPLHAILLAGTVPLFLGVLLSDIAYASSYEVQWKNFASWLMRRWSGVRRLRAAVGAYRPVPRR